MTTKERLKHIVNALQLAHTMQGQIAKLTDAYYVNSDETLLVAEQQHYEHVYIDEVYLMTTIQKTLHDLHACADCKLTTKPVSIKQRFINKLIALLK